MRTTEKLLAKIADLEAKVSAAEFERDMQAAATRGRFSEMMRANEARDEASALAMQALQGLQEDGARRQDCPWESTKVACKVCKTRYVVGESHACAGPCRDNDLGLVIDKGNICRQTGPVDTGAPRGSLDEAGIKSDVALRANVLALENAIERYIALVDQNIVPNARMVRDDFLKALNTGRSKR